MKLIYFKGNIDFIYAVNTELYNKLTLRMKHWSPCQKLGDIFVEMVIFIYINTKIFKYLFSQIPYNILILNI